MTICDGVDVPALIERYQRGLLPLKDREPAGRSLTDPSKVGRFSAGLRDDLTLICTKIAPTMSSEQSDAWIAVMVRALSDLPGRVAREAAQGALHRPMQFISEVETQIRLVAESVIARHRFALRNMRALHAEIERAKQPKLEGATEPPPLTADDIRRMSASLRAVGIKVGAITEDEVEIALVEREPT